MIKRFIALSILIIIASSSRATEPSYPIVYSKKGNLHLKKCESPTDCSFSGTRTLSGKYEFGIDELCDSGEKDGCVSLVFYPNNTDGLPRFEIRNITYITISNYKNAAEQLMGKEFAEKVISSAQAAIGPGHTRNKTIVAKGTAKILIGDYKMGIGCDAGYAIAKMLEVKKRSEVTFEENDSLDSSE
jgi:hypothetical protein